MIAGEEIVRVVRLVNLETMWEFMDEGDSVHNAGGLYTSCRLGLTLHA